MSTDEPIPEAELQEKLVLKSEQKQGSGVGCSPSSHIETDSGANQVESSLASKTPTKEACARVPPTAQLEPEHPESCDDKYESVQKPLPFLLLGIPVTLFLTYWVSVILADQSYYELHKPFYYDLPFEQTLYFRASSFICLLPLHFYWTRCIWLLSQASFSKPRSAGALKDKFYLLGISLVSLLNLPVILRYVHWTWDPSDPYHHYRISTPFDPLAVISFLLWLMMQCGWIIWVWRRIKGTNSKAPLHVWRILLGSAAFFSIGCVFLNSGYPAWFFYSFWFFFQFWCISFLKRQILKLRVPQVSSIKKKDKPVNRVKAGNDIVIEYHPFAAITRWRKQQEGTLGRDLKAVLVIGLPVLLFCFYHGLSFIINFEREQTIRRALPNSSYKAEVIQRQRANYSSWLQARLADRRFPKDNRVKYVSFEIEENGALSRVPYPPISLRDRNYLRVDESNFSRTEVAVINREFASRVASLQPFLPPPRDLLRNGRLPVRISWKQGKVDLGEPFKIDFNLPEDGSQSVVSLKPTANADTGHPQPLAGEDDKNASVSFLGLMALSASAAVVACIGFVSRKPTHLGINPLGWRFIWRRRFKWENGAYVEWTNLARIYMDSPKASTSPLDQRLCFHTQDGRTYYLEMGSLDSVEDRELLLKSIEKFAPGVNRDPSVVQALQPPVDHSYTELWLQALSAPPRRERLKPLAVGTVMRNERYTVLDQIGVGGQGHAYLAREAQGEAVVLKECILPVFVDVNVRRTALEQFENEARLLRQLDHPQIVKLMDFFVEDHRTYLVLEHINGQSLRQMIKSGSKMSEKQVRELCLQMCDLLSYLHKLQPPVVHRDFTPDNLILNEDGKLKLIDFNVAKQVVESTTSGTVVGKHAYLPPEQFRGMPECASDIYALGATLYFLLCGKDPEPISTSRPKRLITELSDSINDLVAKATALDLEKRYKSIDELKADLVGGE